MKFGDIDYFVYFKDVKKMGIEEKNLFAEDDIIYRLIVLCSGERTIILDSSNDLSLRVPVKKVVGLCNKKNLCENSLVTYSLQWTRTVSVQFALFLIGRKVLFMDMYYIQLNKWDFG